MLIIYIDIDFPCRGFSNYVSQHPSWTFTIFLSRNKIMWIFFFLISNLQLIYSSRWICSCWHKENKKIKIFSKKDGLWKSNRTDTASPQLAHVNRMHDGNRMEGVIRKLKTDTVNKKGHPTYFHQYTPSKQIDWQCETGPSIVPYWDHNVILPLFGWISQCYHHKSNKG